MHFLLMFIQILYILLAFIPIFLSPLFITILVYLCCFTCQIGNTFLALRFSNEVFMTENNFKIIFDYVSFSFLLRFITVCLANLSSRLFVEINEVLVLIFLNHFFNILWLFVTNFLADMFLDLEIKVQGLRSKKQFWTQPEIQENSIYITEAFQFS